MKMYIQDQAFLSQTIRGSGISTLAHSSWALVSIVSKTMVSFLTEELAVDSS